MTEPEIIVFAPGPMIRLGGTNIWEGIVPTLRAESHGGDAQPYIAIFFDGYNQKAWEEVTAPLRTDHDSGDCVFIIDGTRVDDVRVYDDEITPCLKSRMGTGGNNVPFIAFASNQRSEVRDIGDIAVSLAAEPGTNQQTYIAQETTHDVVGTLQARSYKGPNHENARDGQLVIETETDMTDMNGSDIAATLRGFGHGWQGQHNSTNAVAQETDMTDPTFSFDTQFGSNANVFEGVAPTMKASQQSPSVAYDEPMAFSHYSSDPSAGDVSPTMRSGTNVSGHAVNIGMVVRRLSPIECERLMGWPDDHTLPRADGKTNSDTTRYKMCGNGVASPVAQWIGEQLMKITDGNR